MKIASLTDKSNDDNTGLRRRCKSENDLQKVENNDPLKTLIKMNYCVKIKV